MKWNHLPEAGGLYDQHPDLLDGFQYIFGAQAEYEAAERKKEEGKGKRGKSPGGASRSR
jgi:hypothetical protein